MKKKKLRQSINSLGKLDSLLKDTELSPPVPDVKASAPPPILKKTDCRDDRELFHDAMADVKPISRNNIIEKTGKQKRRTFRVANNPDTQTLNELKSLIREGKGFVVSSTPEYMEGTNYNVHPEISRRLHKGRFSIQAHLDLHGYTVAGAREAFNAFFKEATLTGKRALLIVHGRGLSSPGEPILKRKVFEWLTCGPWRKWVIAFSSARACDGGAGATYVLLRKSPVTKRMRKRKTPSLTSE
jgi:DNA-nicking Smr family endonuclease